MAYTIPPYEIEAPMRLDGAGRLEFCKKEDAAFFPEIIFGISAAAPDEWRVTDVTIGAQRLSGMNRIRMAQAIGDAYEVQIADHIGEHLGEAKIGARCDAARFMAA